MEEIVISIEKDKLDVGFIHAFITASYWGKGRTIEECQTCINNSQFWHIQKGVSNWLR
jgi:hypothetical protein